MRGRGPVELTLPTGWIPSYLQLSRGAAWLLMRRRLTDRDSCSQRTRVQPREYGMLKELQADFVRHGGTLRSGGFWLLAVYRFGRWSHTLPFALRKLTSGLYGILITAEDLLMGSVVHRETQIGHGLHIIHPESVRIAPGAVIGNRVGIMQGVVVGTTPDRSGTPVVGDDVFIGAGAKVLGPIRIGDRARIAANSLVINDVPADATAIGVPAKVLRYTGRARGTAEKPRADPEDRG